MRRGSTVPAFATALGLLAVLSCGGSPQPATVPGPEGSASQPPNVLTATCKEYDLGANTMDVIAGVSFALREVTFRIHEATQITIRDRKAGLQDMRAGMVVRIEYRVTTQGNLADKIDLVLDATGLR